MSPARIAVLATIVAGLMCCAGAVQLLGVNRIVVTDGRIDAATSMLAPTSLSGTAELNFKSDTFPLERASVTVGG